MKHPVANIPFEGEGHNPFAVVSEGKEAFANRMIKDGHYLRDGGGIPLSEDQRREIAGKAFDAASAFVEETKAAPQDQPQVPAGAPVGATTIHVVNEQDLKSSKELAKLVKLGAELQIPAAAESDPDTLKDALIAAATAAKGSN